MGDRVRLRGVVKCSVDFGSDFTVWVNVRRVMKCSVDFGSNFTIWVRATVAVKCSVDFGSDFRTWVARVKFDKTLCGGRFATPNEE